MHMNARAPHHYSFPSRIISIQLLSLLDYTWRIVLLAVTLSFLSLKYARKV